jgi:hypothetical protein
MMAEQQTTWTGEKTRRRSMRVLLSMPVTVSGKGEDGKAFEEASRTLVVNAHGALIALAAPVKMGSSFTISNNRTKETLECRVAFVGHAQAGKTQVGIEFVNPSPNFWEISFPPDDWKVPES